MTPPPVFESERVEAEWLAAGSSYCEHPDFRVDRGPNGKDPVDAYCTTCGVLRLRDAIDVPKPRGTR